MAILSADQPRVLILGDHFGYADGVRHGATSYFLNTLPALVARGVPLQACFLREPHPAAQELHGQGVVPTFLSSAKWDARVAVRVAGLIRSYGTQLVHAAGVKATLIARMAARIAPARVIVHAHDLLGPSPLLRMGHGLFARAADMGIGVSGAARELLVSAYRVPAGRARVIHNGIDVDRMRRPSPGSRARLRAEWGVAEEAGVVAVIARMHPVKGHRAMLAAMAALLRRRPDAVLVLAGDGPERRPCEALAGRLGIGHAVRFLGARDDVPELLAAADLVAVPSRSEGMSLAAVEAFAAGRPVVGFDSGGLRDVVAEGRTGLLVSQGDHDRLADAIAALLSDRDQLRRMGGNAQAAAARFSIDAHVRQLVACYRDAAAPAAARGGLAG